MIINLGACDLIINTDPFQLTVIRAGEMCLRTIPIDQSVIAIDLDEQEWVVHFSQTELIIRLNEDHFSLQVSPATAELSLIFEIPGHLYGHGELVNQIYPLERLMLPLSQMKTYDNGPAGQSCKLTPAWYSSKGILLQAHSPVKVGINQPPVDYPRYEWSLGADKGPFNHRPFSDFHHNGDRLFTIRGAGLHLDIYMETCTRQAFRRLIDLVGHPLHIPPAELFEKPTWTTWARYKTEVSQEVVLRYAREILEHDFPHHVMEIDDRWQVNYGDLSFDPLRFPDPKEMIEQLHNSGFKVTAWVIPFFDPQSAAFKEGRSRGFFVRRPDGEPYLVPWWQGSGCLLDVTNQAALDWFMNRLLQLQCETGLDGFKFDAGEAIFYPEDAISLVPIEPNEFTRRYIDFISNNFSLTEVRSGWMNQSAPIFFRQWDKWSTWGLDNGLHSVLTGILALGLTGYPFILPDIVGGNAYDQPADDELMIRWTQLNALLPAIQFSLAPWDYGDECTEICRRYAKLHNEFAQQLLEIAGEATREGSPIIRPLWWLVENNEDALTCDDEFLVGNDILVAPIVWPGKRDRDIWLPPGEWRYYWNKQVYQGPCLLKDFPAPMEVLPFFERE